MGKEKQRVEVDKCKSGSVKTLPNFASGPVNTKAGQRGAYFDCQESLSGKCHIRTIQGGKFEFALAWPALA